MNIASKYIIWVLLVIVFLYFIFHNYVEKANKKTVIEGNTSAVEIYSVSCKTPDSAVVQESETDKAVSAAVDDYISTSKTLLDNCITQLQAVLDKFLDISTALEIGNIDVTSPQTQPVIVITDPVNNNIKQRLNFVLPRGIKGERGDASFIKRIQGPNGLSGSIGKQGPDGVYAINEQLSKLS